MASRSENPRAARVWQRMTEFYGVRFTEQYGPKPTKAWCEVIDDADDKAIQAALLAVRISHLQFPPTLPEFGAAIAKASPAEISGKPDVRYQLINFVLKGHHCGAAPLTSKQIAMGWTWIVRWFDALGADGKMHKNHGVEYLGVIVPGDGDHPGYRVMVEDMQLETAA